MKEATGELNMTVVTLVAIAAIGAIFYFVVWPLVQQTLVTQTCRTTYGPQWEARRIDDDDSAASDTSQAKVSKWQCCPRDDAGLTDGCQIINNE